MGYILYFLMFCRELILLIDYFFGFGDDNFFVMVDEYIVKYK